MLGLLLGLGLILCAAGCANSPAGPSTGLDLPASGYTLPEPTPAF